MDFVISDVTTVDPEDDEPLFEVSKVTVFKEKKVEYQTKEVKIPKYTKLCFVPLCPNTSKSTPEKMFITVPVNPARRKLWLDAVGKANGKNPKSPMFCCQDHFNLKKEMKNYEEHLRKGRVQMLLYQTVVPHTFLCNDYGHLKRHERVELLRKLHHEREMRMFEEADDEEEYTQPMVQETRLNKPAPRQRSMQGAKRSKVEVVEPNQNKTVFIEMPAFEYDDQPEYVEIKEGGVDTIVIDDSDSEEY